MTNFRLALAALLTTTAVPVAQAQYLDMPTEAWRQDFFAVGPGNGVACAEDHCCAIASTGDVRCFAPATGDVLWTYRAPQGSTSNSGLTMCYNSAATGVEDYITFSISDGSNTYIVAVAKSGPDASGNPLFQTVPIAGQGSGSPQCTLDKRHTVIVTNSAADVGTFRFIDWLNPNITDPTAVPVLWSQVDPITNVTFRFSPIGVYHNPAGGFYDDPNDTRNNNAGNRNDIFVWGRAPSSNLTAGAGEQAIGNTDGQHYIFQLPAGYSGDGSGLFIMPVGGSRAWQSSTAPVLTNGGYSLYWSHTKAEIRCWVGDASTPTNLQGAYSRGEANKISGVLQRGTPRYISPRAPPTLSSNAAQPMVYGPGAANEVWMSNFDLSVAPVIINTTGVVYSRVLLTPDDAYMLYATDNGLVYMVDATDIASAPLWSSQTTIPINRVFGDMALSPDGSVLVIADANANGNTGSVIGVRIAQAGPTTPPGVAGPSDPPSSSPVVGGVPTTPTPPGATPSPSDMGMPISDPPSGPPAPGDGSTDEPSAEDSSGTPGGESPGGESPSPPPTTSNAGKLELTTVAALAMIMAMV